MGVHPRHPHPPRAERGPDEVGEPAGGRVQVPAFRGRGPAVGPEEEEQQHDLREAEPGHAVSGLGPQPPSTLRCGWWPGGHGQPHTQAQGMSSDVSMWPQGLSQQRHSVARDHILACPRLPLLKQSGCLPPGLQFPPSSSLRSLPTLKCWGFMTSPRPQLDTEKKGQWSRVQLVLGRKVCQAQAGGDSRAPTGPSDPVSLQVLLQAGDPGAGGRPAARLQVRQKLQWLEGGGGGRESELRPEGTETDTRT